ncbi:MAG: DNA-directed RNA polymerase subunit P [Candidatus Diapherotrites archaeon CG11_big_fil_rev_8_21_14_0_20_37_9]|nr:MAG: DNA-directed RNA polymerase subunit P [Candidatus Diapherotrites archaeon CG11_big_fil_rev_8_21_14_0_20_37_9]
MYMCLNCRKEVSMLLPGTIRCPSCGYKVFSKLREPITKTVKAI